MSGIGSTWHWLIVLFIVGLIFGTKRLRNVGNDLGAAIKGFREGVKGSDVPQLKADLPLEPEVGDFASKHVDSK